LSNRPYKLQNMRLTTHFHQVLRLRMHGAIQVLRLRTHGAISPSPLHTFMMCRGITSLFLLYSHTILMIT